MVEGPGLAHVSSRVEGLSNDLGLLLLILYALLGIDLGLLR